MYVRSMHLIYRMYLGNMLIWVAVFQLYT